MWTPQFLDYSEDSFADFDGLIHGTIPAIVIRGLYSQNQCKEIVFRIKNHSESEFQETGLKHIGPFLMSYTTRKKEYFENAKLSQKIFEEIFSDIDFPSSRISNIVRNSLSYDLSLAKESENDYSSHVIRIHHKGHSIPLHKDNVKYEGKEYEISQIDHQLSCILHLQESEKGGNIIIYNRQWKREDEKFRKIEFGYSDNVTESSESCEISNINPGDLVIINPNYYHEVTTIQENSPRITLGMFLGIYKNTHKIFSWA